MPCKKELTEVIFKAFAKKLATKNIYITLNGNLNTMYVKNIAMGKKNEKWIKVEAKIKYIPLDFF
jgi:hypothetical protein